MVERFKTCLKKYFPNGPKIESIIVISLTMILVVLTAVTFSMRKTVTISVDGSDRKVTTFSSTYKKILDNNGIRIGSKDKVKPSLDSRVQNKSKLLIRRAMAIKVEVDGKKLNIESAEYNIKDMLKAEKIQLSNLDKVYPSEDYAIKKGLKVVVTRVTTKDVKETKSIDYDVVIKNNNGIEDGSRKVLQEGQNGEKETITRITYENNKEVSRKVISETVKREPVQQVVAVGTLTGDYTLSRGGNFSHAASLQMRATAYTADYESTGKGPGDPQFGITASGTVARRSSGSYSSIAVDPRVIPLGTKLYVEGYGYAIAEDTGGAIKGNKVDLFFNSASEANNWGVKWVNVYVID
ncbi:3D domain-containing protein [Clostridium sp. WILCCON 0269]|uniref:3D domain-containing protein n=1 Tax=Candidatus Clostridium eludens TaxID=3381663 RepID=A0ABW8SIK1_9CLOT